MTRNQYVALDPPEITACFALHMAYCRDNVGAADWDEHYDRARELASLLPDCPFEDQVKAYEVAA